MNSAQLINQDSKIVEFYTPEYVLNLVRKVIGNIELDPASCEFANKNIVKANRYFSAIDDGLNQDWIADTLFMNHPFSRHGNSKWIGKLVSEYETGNVKEACCITYASTSEKWFRKLHNYSQCYFYKRVNYLDENGNEKKGVTKGSVVTYFGKNVNKFAKVFNEIGSVKIPVNLSLKFID